MPERPRIPTGTYRVQLHREFGFADAADLVPYLADLGVSHVYCSPILEAVPGSMHGYDVVDHTRLSDDLGGAAAWRHLVDTCHAHGLGIVVDVVPNHMAIPTPERLNKPLWDVLTHGRESSYASWFDIDWDAEDGKILMPMLGRPLAECLRDGEIEVDAAAGVVRYYDHEFPLAPGTHDLDAQHYRLEFWRSASECLNYRRFFDVTTLIGVRVELPPVFDGTHALLAKLVAAGDIDALRIDHPDGLADPGGYLEALRGATGGVWTVVEKILEGRETLPTAWACDGTTGYDALAAVTGVLVDRRGEQPLTETYRQFTGRTDDFESVVVATKRLVVERFFGAEVNRLLRDLEPVRAQAPEAAGYDVDGLRSAIVELLVRFDVYRAYVGDAESRHHLEAAVAQSAKHLPEHASEAQWLGRVLAGELRTPEALAFATRFEQTTGPATAKGVEDTAFYRYLRLVALNEVGGDPGEFGRSVDEWHDYCERTARDWPATMTTLSTHDTKRSEDVRARLLVLAELPQEWERAVTRWRERAETVVPNTDYLLWQTLVGAWPIDEQRVQAYLEKATKEAKEQTSWTDPDDVFAQRLRDHVHRVFADVHLMREVGEWVDRFLAEPGRSNSLAQKLLQLTMPGVPDVYQGQELPDFSLVDPDNRRPVDYLVRRAQLASYTEADPKLRVTTAALRLRRQRPETFRGRYVPLRASGAAADHVVAYLRGDDVVTVVTRLPVTLGRRGGWTDTTVDLPNGQWRDVITGAEVSSGRVGDMLTSLPVALLERTP